MKEPVPNDGEPSGGTQAGVEADTTGRFTTPGHDYSEPTELVFATVGPIGTDHGKIRRMIAERLRLYRYEPKEIHISSNIIPILSSETIPKETGFERSNALIDAGNRLRELARDNAFLATAAAAKIKDIRGNSDNRTVRSAFVISSLKHPEEVEELRRIYGRGFFLFAIHQSKSKRREHLVGGGFMSEEQAQRLIDRDECEDESHGQHMRDTFHLADLFLVDEGREDKLRFSIERCLDLVFGRPTLTPTFNEFAMFLAFASALRSGDLSRQVGAVVARDRQILSTGANDCPTFGGGLYWPQFSEDEQISDAPEGRDFVRTITEGGVKKVGFDSNSKEKARIIKTILSNLKLSGNTEAQEALERGPIGDITEYGRSVHAEMEALLACARGNISCAGASVYCTTFPCHNCAKHIIAAGIVEVVFVEPYPKSRALDFHQDSAVLEDKKDGYVRFKPFVGVGPRRFFDLFSITWGSGVRIQRKTTDGNLWNWNPREALPRFQLLPVTYHEFEEVADNRIKDFLESFDKEATDDKQE